MKKRYNKILVYIYNHVRRLGDNILLYLYESCDGHDWEYKGIIRVCKTCGLTEIND